MHTLATRALYALAFDRGGLARCPASWHQDGHPSCSVGIDASQEWKCHSASCGAGEAFLRAGAYGADVFGELT